MTERVGRGSLTGRWEPRPGAEPNIRGGITIERDLRAGTKLWLTGWTTAIAGGEFVSVLVEVADKCRGAVPDEDRSCAPTAPCATDEAHGTLRCDLVSGDTMDTEAVGAASRSPPSAAERDAPSSQAAPPGNALSLHLVTRNANRRARAERTLKAGGPRRSRSNSTGYRCPHQRGIGQCGVRRNG